jgi:hypothetical protein
VSKPPKRQAGILANGCVGDINQTGETYIFEESLFSQIFSTFIFPYLFVPLKHTKKGQLPKKTNQNTQN